MFTQTQQASTKTEYFNLTIKGMGYLSNIRQVNGPNGTFISCVVNGLSGPTDNASYTRFDVTVASNVGGTMQMLGGRSQTDNPGPSASGSWGQPQQPTHSGTPIQASAGNEPPMDFDDDIPF